MYILQTFFFAVLHVIQPFMHHFVNLKSAQGSLPFPLAYGTISATFGPLCIPWAYASGICSRRCAFLPTPRWPSNLHVDTSNEYFSCDLRMPQWIHVKSHNSGPLAGFREYPVSVIYTSISRIGRSLLVYITQG